MMPAREVLAQMDELTRLGVPYLFAIDYEQQEGMLIAHPEHQTEVLYNLRGKTNCPWLSGALDLEFAGASLLDASPPSLEEYAGKYLHIERALERGDSFLANLTIATPVTTPLSLEEVYHHATAPYKLYVPDRFVCFSPESFVQIEGERITTYPMKGTIDASLPDADRCILADPKETAEHYTIVDLMRSDLARVGSFVTVEDFRYIDRVKTLSGELLQVSSRIAATITPELNLRWGSLLARLLPAGSISGAPKEATMLAIAGAEGESRGFYTGVFGLWDGVFLDSAVLIRLLSRRPDGTLYYHSGGGITINSCLEDEYHEAIAKIYLPIGSPTRDK